MIKKERFVRLSWTILEAKYAYYYPIESKIKVMLDEEYDALEKEYKDLAKELKIEPTASNHVGFPRDLPCGRLVMNKALSKKKFKYSIED